MGWGYPIQLDSGVPASLDKRVPCGAHPPPVRLDGVTPITPPPQETEQHSEYLLYDGRYASCVHVGLSCSIMRVCVGGGGP